MAQLARDEAGNVWEVDAQGNPVRLVQAANGPAPIAPPNPALQFEPQKAQADAQRAQAEAALATAQTPYAGQLAQAEAARASAEAQKALAQSQGEPLTSKARVDAEQAAADAQALYDLAGELRARFARGPGATSGVSGLADYFPTAENKTFNDVGQQARGLVKRALGFTGGEGNTATESSALYDPFLPRASDRDEQILQKINSLEELARRSATMSSNLLGKPLPAFVSGQQPNIPGSAMDMIRTNAAGPETEAVGMAPVGTQQFRMVQNPEFTAAHDDLVNNLIAQGGGRLDPGAYATAVGELAQRFGFQDTQGPAARANWARSVNEYLDAGGRTINTGATVREVMSAADTARNNLINNPVGGALSGLANTLSFGGVEAMAPNEYQALRDVQPLPTLAGEVAGAVGGTMALGRLGANTIGRAAPSLMGGGGRGQFLRNVAADTAYGAGYGGVSQGDPLSGAVIGAGGSVVGQGVARGLGAAVGGLRRTPEAQTLVDAGVPVSVARQVGLGRAEDFMQSAPFAGEAVRGRQMESFEGLNRAMLQQAGEPIGFVPNQLGRAGVEDLGRAVSNTYNQSVQGVVAPLDRQFMRDLVPVRKMARQMSPTNQAQLTETLRDAMQLPMDARAITAQQFQDATSNLKALRANAKGAMPNSAQTLRNAATKTIEALEGAMSRAGGQSVIEGLGKANAANRGYKVARDAMLRRAQVGTQAGEVNVATPAQWIGALGAAESRGFGNNAAMRTLAEDAQRVLPSTVPNSGTADRLMAMGLLGTAGGLGGVTGYDQQVGPASAAEGAGTFSGGLAGTGALLGLLGTRRGQQVLERILISRPQVAQTVGQGFRRRAGLFGSASNVVGQDYGY